MFEPPLPFIARKGDALATQETRADEVDDWLTTQIDPDDTGAAMLICIAPVPHGDFGTDWQELSMEHLTEFPAALAKIRYDGRLFRTWAATVVGITRVSAGGWWELLTELLTELFTIRHDG